MSEQTSFFDAYMAAKKQAMKKQVDISAKFEELCKDLLEHNDINTFEKIISKIVHDGFLINVSGITCKLDNKSIELCNKMFVMFTGDNIKHPIKDYSKNDDILKFMENFKEPKLTAECYPMKQTNTEKRCKCDKYNNYSSYGDIPFMISLKDLF